MISMQHVLAVLALATLTQACAPLQQAPLVYSSKQSLGVDFSAASTEQPGMALNVGFKSVDAAYVPVAVAKACDTAVDSKGDPKISCGGDNYRLREIKGNRSNSDSSNSGANANLEEARTILQKFAEASAVKKAAEAEVHAAESEKQKLAEQLKDAAKAADAARQAVAAATQRQNQAPSPEALQALNSFTSDLQTAEATVAKLTAARKEVEASLAKSLAKAGQAQANLDQMSLTKIADALKVVVTENSQRVDAYSVFGSFSANTSFGTSTSASAASANSTSTGNAVAATAGVNLGKIFSTGVASQNLTEGIRDYYARSAAAAESSQTTYAKCLEATSTALKHRGLAETAVALTADQKKMVEAAYELCMPPEKKTTGATKG